MSRTTLHHILVMCCSLQGIPPGLVGHRVQKKQLQKAYQNLIKRLFFQVKPNQAKNHLTFAKEIMKFFNFTSFQSLTYSLQENHALVPQTAPPFSTIIYTKALQRSPKSSSRNSSINNSRAAVKKRVKFKYQYNSQEKLFQ